MTQSVLDLTCELVSRPSVTPNDAGCQKALRKRLETAGFDCEDMQFGEVRNLWARHGAGKPLFALLGHTDVVPSGNIDRWTSHPFTPEIRNDYLYGRGAADMKSGVAAMVVAAERFVRHHPNHVGSIALIITSDEEGIAEEGTKRVIQTLTERSVSIDYCVVGEPSSHEKIGDTVRVGRRGSLTGTVRVLGKQGHVAFPETTPNPIHSTAKVLAGLAGRSWDKGNEHFPPTSFQIANIRSGTGAANVIPGELHADFNFRFNTEQTPEKLQAEVEKAFRNLLPALDVDIDWHLSGHPFLCRDGQLLATVQDSIQDRLGYKPKLSTGGGTSDGRFVAPTGAEVVELGPVNESIHGIDERVRVADLEILVDLYIAILMRLLT